MTDPASSSAPAVDRDNPWPGLASFTEDAREFFFGREKETDELLRLVRRQTLTVLFGQSGLGKSSLLQAGVFPVLRDADFIPLYLRLDHDPATPALAEQVKAALTAAFAAAKADAPAFRLDETLWEYFHRKDVDVWSAKNRLLTPVLAFDQFEEIFTLGRASDAARERSRAFLTELTCLVENRAPPAVQARLDRGELDPARFNFEKPSCQVILSLREDFLPDLEGLKAEMPALIHNRLRLKRLNGAQALEIVTKPGGHLLAEGVAERIVEFVAGARGGSSERLAELDVEPPLLSVICRELNDRRRARGQDKITADLVSGNRREILHDFYERSVADLPEAMRTFVEDHLLTKSGFRDNLALETALEFPGVTRPLLDTLVARRLLRIEDRLGVQRVELTHDVLAEVIRAARDERQQRSTLVAAARRARRQRWIIAGLATTVAGLLVGAFFGIRAQRRAEQAVRDEAARSSRTDFIFGSQLLEQDKVPEGLAYLVRAAHSDPTNNVVGPRLISALVNRSFAEPIAESLPHPAGIIDVVYANDSRHGVTTTTDGLYRYWDLPAGKLLQTIDAGVPNLWINLSADSRRIAALDANGAVNVWELATGHRVLGPLKHQQAVSPGAIGFSPDGRWLATGGADRVAKIWDASSGELKATLRHENAVTSIDFSLDGSLVLTVETRGPLRIWHAVDGGLVGTIKPAGGTRVTIVASSRDGKLVAVGDDSGAQVYETATAAAVGARLPHSGPCYFAAFTSDGTKLVTTSEDTTAHVWEVPSGRSLLPPMRHGGGVRRARLTADDRHLITVSLEGVARVWELATGRLAIEPIRVGDVAQIDLAPDAHEFVTGGRDGALRRWQVTPGAAAPFQFPPDQNRLIIARSAAGPTIAWVVFRDRMQKFDLLTGKPAGAARLFPTPITGARLAPDERHLAVSRGANIELELWDLTGAEIERRRLGATNLVLGAVFSDDSSHLLLANGGNVVRVWNTNTGALALGPLENASRIISFSPDSRQVAIALSDNSAVVWDLATGAPVGDPLRHRGPVFGVKFSPDGRLIATSSGDRTAQIWDAKTHRALGPPLLHRNYVRDAAFTHDSRRVVTWTPLAVRVWDVATGTPLTEPMVGGNDITNVVWSEDDTRIATWARSGREARIWGGVSGQLLAEPMKSGFAGGPLDFVGSDRFLASGLGLGFSLFALPPQSGHKPTPPWLLRLATAVAGGEIGPRGNFQEQAFDAKVFDQIRSELAALPDDAPYVAWSRWFLADRATRPIAPGFAITSAEAENLAKATAPAAAP